MMLATFRYIFLFLFLFLSFQVQAQFITIMGEKEVVKRDSIAASYESPYDASLYDDEEEFDTEESEEEEDEEAEKKKPFKRLFGKIGAFFKKPKVEKDTVPSDPELFSYDQIENEGVFIFTEADEQAYLDSIKYELIKKRRLVLQRRAMVSMPLDELRITSHFGYRSDPFTKQIKFHNGVDFAARNNFIYAILPGIVDFAGYRGGYGYCVEMRHGKVRTLYAHLSYILVQKNQPVPAGEPIGISGTTGRSTGEHLHFSVISNGKFRDPMPLLDYLSQIQTGQQDVRDDFPSYEEFMGKSKVPETAASVDSIPKEEEPAPTPSPRTSGMMIVSEEAQREVKGVVRHGDPEPQPTNNGQGIIHYSGSDISKKESEGIIHHSDQHGKDNPQESEEEKGSTTINGMVLPPMRNSVRNGMILPSDADSIRPVKALGSSRQQ